MGWAGFRFFHCTWVRLLQIPGRTGPLLMAISMLLFRNLAFDVFYIFSKLFWSIPEETYTWTRIQYKTTVITWANCTLLSTIVWTRYSLYLVTNDWDLIWLFEKYSRCHIFQPLLISFILFYRELAVSNSASYWCESCAEKQYEYLWDSRSHCQL